MHVCLLQNLIEMTNIYLEIIIKNCYKALSFHLSLQKQSFDKCCTFFSSFFDSISTFCYKYIPLFSPNSQYIFSLKKNHSILTMTMASERVRVDQSFKNKTSIVDVHILVVDDDTTSLAIVSAMLRTWKYDGTFFFCLKTLISLNLASCLIHR